MKEYLVSVAWMVFWMATSISLTTCMPKPAGTIGDGAVQQYGFFNMTTDNRVSHGPPPEKPVTTIRVDDKGVAITMPKR